MPVRFLCQHCHKTLSIARRKIGTRVDCPICGGAVNVPEEDEASVAVAMKRATTRKKKRKHEPPHEAPDAEWWNASDADERPLLDSEGPPGEPGAAATLVDSPPGSDSSDGHQADDAFQPVTPVPVRPAPSPPHAVPIAEAAPTGRYTPSESRHTRPGRSHKAASNKITITRTTLFAQGALIALVGVAAFVLGLLSGRLAGPITPGGQAAMASIVVDGRIELVDAVGDRTGDLDAIVIALPVDRVPRQRLTAIGLGAIDPTPDPDNKTLQSLIEAGGAYDRTRDDGGYSLVLPHAGDYRIVVISGNVDRPKGQGINPGARAELGRFFDDPDWLIGNRKYLTRVEECKGPVTTLSFEFAESTAVSRPTASPG
jgi:hypothetical protein